MAQLGREDDKPRQTHSVLVGKYPGDPVCWRPGYQDGDVIRRLHDGEIIAQKTRKGWNRTIKAVKRGRFDDIRPLSPEAVQVHLNKGQFY